MVTSQIEGSQVYEMLRTHLDQTRRELAGVQEETSRLERSLRDLLARRGETLLQLARHDLPEISRPAIEQTFAGIRGDLLAILDRRDALQQSLRNQMDQDQQASEARTRALDDVTERLNKKVAERERLEAEVAASLKANDDFQRRSVLALQAEEALHRDEQRAEELAREAAAKLPSYEKSRLFRYLRDRRYGTDAYTASGWVRSLDAWVARMIDFGNARIGYDFLTKTPALVAQEVERRRDAFTPLMQQVEAIEQAEADRLGLTAVLREGDALGTERDACVRDINAIHARLQQTQQELAALDQRENRFYREAVEKMTAFLGDTRLAILEQRARSTPDTRDDALVNDLVRLARETEDVQARLAQTTEQKAAFDREQDQIDQLIRRYRQANFDSQRSYFDPSLDLQRSLSRLQTRQIDADRLWRAIQSSQRFRPHMVETTTDMASQAMATTTGRVLMGALIEVAGHALQDAAVRGVQRQGYNPAPSSMPVEPPPTISYEPPPQPQPQAPAWSPPPPSEGSFTSGEGF